MKRADIEQATKLLTFTNERGATVAPPMFDELCASGIYDKVRTDISAMNTASCMRARLVHKGESVEENDEVMFAQHLLLQSLEHAMLVAAVLVEEESTPVLHIGTVDAIGKA